VKPRPTGRWAAALAAVLAVAGSARAGRAVASGAPLGAAEAGGGGGGAPGGAEPTPDAVPGPPSIAIAVVGSPADLQKAHALTGRGTLGGVTPRWTRIDHFTPLDVLRQDREPAGAPTLRCWLDFTDPRRVRLYFASRSGEHFLVRDVELSGRFDQLDRESLGQVLELSMTALLEDERIGLTRSETRTLLESRSAPAAPESAAPPPPLVVERPPAPPPPATSPRFGAAVFYAGQVLAGGLPVVHGPGVRLWSRVGDGGDVWLSGHYQVPQTEAGDRIGLRFQSVSARAGVGWVWPLGVTAEAGRGALFQLDLRLGGGADAVRLAPLPGTTDPSAVPTSARWSESLVVTAGIGVGAALGRWLRLSVIVFADWLPTAVEYDLDVGGNPAAVFSPWRVRPGLALELTFR
jgi:hypothetical protein